MSRRLAIACIAAATAALGCWAGQDVDRTGDHVVARSNAVVVEGCALDDAQTTTLSQASTKRVLGEVILLCAAIQPTDATIAPVAADDRTALTAQVQALHALGYRVSIATTIGTSWDAPASPNDTTKAIETLDRSKVASGLAAIVSASGAEGLELAFPAPTIDASVRASLTLLVRAIGDGIGSAPTLGVFLPPTSQQTDDVEGGDAYDPNALEVSVDRFRLMTLDYSCCGAPPGPTIDPGWAVDVQRFGAQRLSSGKTLDVAYPLYGWDTTLPTGFGDPGSQTDVTYTSAESLAATLGASVQRGPTGAPYFDYTSSDGKRHEVWFDDATSTLRALHAWNDALPSDVGVVFYGLGAEDPRLWNLIAKELPSP